MELHEEQKENNLQPRSLPCVARIPSDKSEFDFQHDRIVFNSAAAQWLSRVRYCYCVLHSPKSHRVDTSFLWKQFIHFYDYKASHCTNISQFEESIVLRLMNMCAGLSLRTSINNASINVLGYVFGVHVHRFQSVCSTE